MAFNSTGAVHYDGIANEKQTIETLNRLGIFEDEVTHRGGTQSKADAVAGNRSISIKQKKTGIGVGSFDWVNTTRVPSPIARKFENFIAAVKQLRTLTEEQRKDSKDDLRDFFNQTGSEAFDALTTADLVSFLRQTFAKQDGYDIVITDSKAGNLYHFPAEAHPALRLIAEGYVPTFAKATKANQTSRTLVFVKGNESVRCGLRLRIVSNNGIGAFLGLGANRSSSVVFKLQQDNVPALLEATNADRYSI